jgi:DNA-binding MarR family transcriptional regulator
MPNRAPDEKDPEGESGAAFNEPRSDDRAPAGLPELLMLLLMASSRLIMAEASKAAPEVQLTPPQFRLLNHIYRHPKASLSQVAQHLGVRLPTASVMLVKLAQDGLVRRDRDPQSRRRMQLELTETGLDITLKLRAALFERMEARLRRLPAEERAALERAMPALQSLFSD